jgi:hypothetical protein
MASDEYPINWGWSPDYLMLLTLEVWIDGQLEVFRDAYPADLFTRRFIEPKERENFLNHWIRQRVGWLAKEPEQLAKFRKKLLVAEPGDPHDYPRCQRSEDNPMMRVRCAGGQIQRMPALFGNEGGLEPVRSPFLGECPCRCHDVQRHVMACLPGGPVPPTYFRESSLTMAEALA